MEQFSFYNSIDSYPFKRDIDNIDLHFKQRSLLLRNLGVVPKFLEGKRVLEIGGGYGENALFLLAQKPSSMTLMEISNECLLSSKDLLDEFKFSHEINTKIDYLCVDFKEYKRKKLYDFVVFEGVIPFEPDPSYLLHQTVQHVSNGGVVSITCIDPVSLFPEVLRRLVSILLAPVECQLEDRVDILLPIFKSHLSTLSGMSRDPKDWVIDQMIHPWSGKSFSILEAAKVISDKFEILGSSPQFFNDWSWFREVENARSISSIEEQYYSNLHNFIDYRFFHSVQPVKQNKLLLALCNRVLKRVRKMESGFCDLDVIEIRKDIVEVCEILSTYATDTADDLQDFILAFDSIYAHKKPVDFRGFASLFGRGQQYVSFIKV